MIFYMHLKFSTFCPEGLDTNMHLHTSMLPRPDFVYHGVQWKELTRDQPGFDCISKLCV